MSDDELVDNRDPWLKKLAPRAGPYHPPLKRSALRLPGEPFQPASLRRASILDQVILASTASRREKADTRWLLSGICLALTLAATVYWLT
jgi:hypothetical protein